MRQSTAPSIERRLGFRLLFTRNPVPMWVYDLETLHILEVNDAAIAGYGYAREEFLSMRAPELRAGQFPLDDAGAPNGLRPCAAVERHRRKGGDLIDVHLSAHVVRFAGRSAVLAVAEDMTGRRRADAALRESEERYRRLVDEASDAIYTVDLEGRFTSINRQATVLTGYTGAEALAADFSRVVEPGDLEFLKDVMKRKLAGEEVGPYEIRIVAKDGRRIPVELNGHVVYQNGRPAGFQGIVRDLTERRRAEDDLRARIALMHRVLLIGKALARPLPIDEAIPLLGEGAQRLGGTSRVAMFVRQPGDAVTCPWRSGISDDYVGCVIAQRLDLHEIAIELAGAADRRVGDAGRPFLCADMESLSPDLLARRLARSAGYRAVGVWPLIYGGRVTALIFSYYDTPRTWSMAEHDAFEAFCRQGAVALENARLYDAMAHMNLLSRKSG